MPVPTSSLLIDKSRSMASKTGTSSGSSHSVSPSPELASPAATSSNNASPISVPSLLYTGQSTDEAEPDQRSTRSTPTRNAVDLTRSQSAGKGGCWTCRVRRKKCDEEREGDSCKTCLRLRIKCLGWGPKRPEWMRDKEKVAEYKAGIKEQLTRAGLIRGQPRHVYLQHAQSSSSVIPSQQLGNPAVAGPGPSTSSLRRSLSGGATDLSYRHSYGDSSPYSHGSGMLPVLSGAASAQSDVTSMNTSFDSSLNDPMFFASPTIPIVPNVDPYDSFLSGNEFAPAMHPQGVPAVLDSSINQEEYLVYYFQNVRKYQFAFAGSMITNTLYSIVSSDQRGVLANALSALASLHDAQLQSAHSQSQLDLTAPRFFYDQAAYQLINTKTMHGQYSENDALAAIYLIAFSTHSRGATNWQPMLDVACDWLSQTGIHDEQNPKLTLIKMSSTGRLAAKATMWTDIMSSVTFMQPPRFLSLYRRLFGGGAGYWATSEHFDLRMDMLTGCPDEAVLAIAEVAALAHWKANELRNGSLSMRELIRRGDIIEQQLKQRPASRNFSEMMDKGSPNMNFLSPAELGAVPLAGGLPAAPSSPHALGDETATPTEDTRRTVAKIFRETAILYLHTVLSESHPGVPEIISSVNTLSDLFQQIPPSEYDRSMIFPICLTGCMSDDPLMRELVKQRCRAHQDNYVGNMYQALTLLDNVWNRRAAALNSNRRGAAVDWREILRDRWSNLLLS